jgi:hypothetical protein
MSVLRELKRASIVSGLQVREALGARDLAVLEPQAGKPEAADGVVGASTGGDQDEATDRSRVGSGRCHAMYGRRSAHRFRWPAR